MNKKELITNVSNETGLSKLKTKIVLETMISIAKRTLINGESVQIDDYATLSVASVKSVNLANNKIKQSNNRPEKKEIVLKLNCPVSPHIL